MQLPDSVKAYFESEQPADSEAFLAAFTDDAIVEDEGARREGLDAIHAWWTAARRRYQYTAKPIETTGTGNRSPSAPWSPAISREARRR